MSLEKPGRVPDQHEGQHAGSDINREGPNGPAGLIHREELEGWQPATAVLLYVFLGQPQGIRIGSAVFGSQQGWEINGRRRAQDVPRLNKTFLIAKAFNKLMFDLYGKNWQRRLKAFGNTHKIISFVKSCKTGFVDLAKELTHFKYSH